MGRMTMLIKVATVAGPTIVEIVRRYGPAMKTAIDNNPELFTQIKGRVSAVSSVAKSKSPGKLTERIGVLREQVTYLYASADNPEEAVAAKRWRAELEQIERAIPILHAMGKKQQKSEISKLSSKLDKLSAEILAASIREEIEDAEIVED